MLGFDFILPCHAILRRAASANVLRYALKQKVIVMFGSVGD
jgi:hypothetical protein